MLYTRLPRERNVKLSAGFAHAESQRQKRIMGVVNLANQAMAKALALYEAFEELADDGTIQAVKEEALAVYGHGKIMYDAMKDTAVGILEEAHGASEHLTVIFAIAQKALEHLMMNTRAMPKALDAMTSIEDLAVGVAAEIER